MNSEILGSYLPKNSMVHRARPGLKLSVLFLGAVAAMVWRSVPSATAALTVAVVASIVAQLGVKRVARSLLRFAFIAAILFAFQAFSNGPSQAYAVVGTLIAFILAANVFTATTRTEDLLETLTWALRPLRIVGVKSARVALTFSLAIRMIPELMTVAHETRDAARARGLDRSFRARLIPLVIRTVSRAESSGEALAARGITDDTR